MYYDNIIKNGLYLPFISFFIYLFTEDIYLPIFFFLKAYTINYYYNFCNLYPQPELYKWRHMFRLTDTGHILAFMFYFNKKFTPLAHNIHLTIDVGYYVAKYGFNMNDTDLYQTNDFTYNLIKSIHKNLNHNLSYILIFYYMISNKKREYDFDNYSLIYTFLWLYIWLIFIYTPWVLLTNDYIYSVLEPSKPFYLRFGMILFMSLLGYLSNNFGKLITSI